MVVKHSKAWIAIRLVKRLSKDLKNELLILESVFFNKNMIYINLVKPRLEARSVFLFLKKIQ